MKPDVVILDLDGPILDGAPRQYALYAALLNERGFTPAHEATYTDWKRERIPVERYLAHSDMTGEDCVTWFRAAWLTRIESDEFLCFDRVQPGARETLTRWKEEGLRLVVATQRQRGEGVVRQLERNGLLPLFESVLVCPHREGAAGKANRVRDYLREMSPAQCVWIGDTEIDVDAARKFGCPVYAVTCGVRSHQFLEAQRPNLILPSLSEVVF